MGIINVTPDSFSDGGACSMRAAAIDAGVRMVEEGADLLDVGGESTRPGAAALDEAEEQRRVLPVIEGLAARVRVPISIDTYKAAMADAALGAGASIVNDVSGLRYEPELADVVARRGAPIVLMHTRGRSQRHVPAGVVSRRRRRSARRAAREHGVCGRRRRCRGAHHRRSRARLREGGAAQLRSAGAARRVRRARVGRSSSDRRASRF